MCDRAGRFQKDHICLSVKRRAHNQDNHIKLKTLIGIFFVSIVQKVFNHCTYTIPEQECEVSEVMEMAHQASKLLCTYMMQNQSNTSCCNDCSKQANYFKLKFCIIILLLKNGHPCKKFFPNNVGPRTRFDLGCC